MPCQSFLSSLSNIHERTDELTPPCVRCDVGAVCSGVPVDIDGATRCRLNSGRIDRSARCRLIGMHIGQR